MEDRETPRMHKYAESKTTRVMMANCTSRDFQFRTWKISGRLSFAQQGLKMRFTKATCINTFYYKLQEESGTGTC